MQKFANARDAKEFLVGRIMTESQLENVPLSDVERKMLYFSESGWTLPDIADVSDTFDRDYDQRQYEKKVSALISNLHDRARKDDPEELAAWKQAVQTLRREDHYILVMIDAAENSLGTSGLRVLKLLILAFGLIGIVLLVGYILFRN